jgi:hypothetical protein
MNKYINEYAQKAYDILEPLVGGMMASGTLKMQTAAIGCTEETITKKDLPQLAEGIRKGLVIFLGSDTASKVASKISQLA